MTTYLLILGDKRGTAWVLRESRTALARERVRDAKRVEPGDSLLLYASGSAFPGGKSGLFGLGTVTRRVEYLPTPFRLNFKEFHADLPFRFDVLTPFGHSVEMQPLVADLALFAGNREKWGVYLRRPIIALSEPDAALLRQALEPLGVPAEQVLPDYLAATNE